jgi:hypothetical protein
MLLRALIYRITTHDNALGPAGWTPDQVSTYRPVIDLATEYVKSRLRQLTEIHHSTATRLNTQRTKIPLNTLRECRPKVA